MNKITIFGIVVCIIALLSVPFTALQQTNIAGTPISGLGLATISLPLAIIGVLTIIISLIIAHKNK